MRTAMAIGRRLAVGVGGGSNSSSSQQRRMHLATATTTSTSSFSSLGRKRIGKLNTASKTVLDSRDLAVSESGDDEDFEERGEEEEEVEEESDEDTVAKPSHLFPPRQHQQEQQKQQQQQHPSRALRGSLLATQTLRAQRKSAQEISASPTRFPLTGTFAFDGGGKEVGGQGGGAGGDPSSPPPPPLFLSAREVISAVSPFVSEERLRRIRDVARARCFTVLPIVEGLFDRGNLGAVCRTVRFRFSIFFLFTGERDGEGECDETLLLTLFPFASFKTQAEAMGVGAVWACDISSDRYRATRGRCSAGSEKWIDVQVFGKTGKGGRTTRSDDWREEKGGAAAGPSSSSSSSSSPQSSCDSAGTLACLRAAKAAGFRVVVAAAGPGAVTAEHFDWESAPTAFVVGNEARGVSAEARELGDAEIVVPMVGMVESLNVSVASACIMQAALGRIRRRGGNRSHLSSPSVSEEIGGQDDEEERREREVDALVAAMLLRHKGQQGKVGALWQAPMMRAILARGNDQPLGRRHGDRDVGVVAGGGGER